MPTYQHIGAAELDRLGQMRRLCVNLLYIFAIAMDLALVGIMLVDVTDTAIPWVAVGSAILSIAAIVCCVSESKE